MMTCKGVRVQAWRSSSNRALTTTGLQADEIDKISDVSNTVRLSDVKKRHLNVFLQMRVCAKAIQVIYHRRPVLL